MAGRDGGRRPGLPRRGVPRGLRCLRGLRPRGRTPEPPSPGDPRRQRVRRMRLASKIFLTSVLVIVVLGGVSALSLHAIGQLVSANREVSTHAVPALGVSASLRDSLQSLARIESRYLALRDRSYLALWDERATKTGDELERLRGFPAPRRAATILEGVQRDFQAYRRVVAREHELLRAGRRGG